MKPPLEYVRDALHEAGKDMKPLEWKALLEEIAADIEGHLDALRDEAEEDADAYEPTGKNYDSD